jgi:hypothetical protein
MIEALLKSRHPILRAMFNVIGSQASPGGRSPSSSQDGRTTDLSGQPASHANLSPQPGSKQAPTTSDTSGQSFNALSASADLQRSLASRWQARLQGKNGSPEYVWTCKQWVIPSQPSIFALRSRARTAKDGLCVEIRRLGSQSSSEHPTSGSGSTGSHIVGWPTPQAIDASGQGREPRLKKDGNRNPNLEGSYRADLKDAAYIVGWATPATRDHKDTGDLEKSRFRQDGKERNDTMARQAQLIQTSTSSPAATAKLGVLNAALPRWLQGYPVEWCQAAIRAHRAMPTKRRKPA